MRIDSEARSKPTFLRAARGRIQRIHFWMVWLSFMVLSSAGWMRMADSIRDWYWLDLAGVSPGPRYLILTGALWGAAGLAAAVWLLRGSSGRAAATWIALGIVTSYWIDRLLVDVAPLAGSNAPFALLLTLLWLAFVAQGLRSWCVFAALFRRARKSSPEADR